MDLDTKSELEQLLQSIQNRCREYPTQNSSDRKLTFASIRIAAESIDQIAEDYCNSDTLRDIRSEVHQITQHLDDLLASFGSDEQDECKACGAQLKSVKLDANNNLEYCTNCPKTILEAVREISDLAGVDVI